MAFTEDFSIFLDTDVFGDTATIGANTFVGILDAAYAEVETGRVSVDGSRLLFTCTSDDVATYSVAYGSTLTINSVSYKVVGVEPDGTGVTTLVLDEA